MKQDQGNGLDFMGKFFAFFKFQIQNFKHQIPRNITELALGLEIWVFFEKVLLSHLN